MKNEILGPFLSAENVLLIKYCRLPHTKECTMVFSTGPSTDRSSNVRDCTAPDSKILREFNVSFFTKIYLKLNVGFCSAVSRSFAYLF